MNAHNIVAAVMDDYRLFEKVRMAMGMVQFHLNEFIPGYDEASPEQKAEALKDLGTHFFKMKPSPLA